MKEITLEMSCKCFKRTDDAYIADVCRKMFMQWKPLLVRSEQVGVMLWTGDGSELLDYAGDLEISFEWCYWVSDAPRRNPKTGEDTQGYLYMDNPPVMTYGILQRIIRLLKKTAKEILGEEKTVRVGTTFDPGPEFARSSFKYVRHNELCSGHATSGSVMICAYETLKGDTDPYAAFPDGIPDGTPFGTFLGRQAKAFMTDMGFDFIWLSNGFGFGKDTWSPTGAIFDGEHFFPEALEETKQKVARFWELFTAELGDFEIETRGTNMSMGIDLARDGVPLRQLYRSGYRMMPPPNSPWAALNGDYGLELMGYMSRIAEIPADAYLLRYYLHDPWFMNSPWYDRYNGQPHDIYLPMSVARINEAGEIMSPTNLHLFSVDNSLGNMPEACVLEPLPHLLKALKQMPDAPAPVVWVYPFEEYAACGSEQEMQQMYAEDWWIWDAINLGLPLSMVTSTTAFCGHDKRIYDASVLVTPVPKADSRFEEVIIKYVASGGKVIFYGNSSGAGKRFRDLFRLSYGVPVSGELEISVLGKPCGKILHTPVICGGEILEVSSGAEVLATAGQRPVAVRAENGIWIRGTVSCSYVSRDSLLQMFSEREYYLAENLMMLALGMLGYEIRFQKSEYERSPVILLHRNNHALILSAFQDSTTVKTLLRFPWGAPVLDAYETVIENGYATYHFPKSERREIRAFVVQESGIVKCREYPPGTYNWRSRRRIELSGLRNATVRFLGEQYCMENLEVQLNPTGVFESYTSHPVEWEYVTIDGVRVCEVRNVTGTLFFNMPFPEGAQRPVLYVPEK